MVKSGIFSSFTVVLQDQNFNFIEANDNNVLIALLLKQGPIKKLPLYKQLKNIDEYEYGI